VRPGSDDHEVSVTPAGFTALAARIDDVVLAWARRLVALSHELHADPETAFAEHRAAERLAAVAEQAGFAVNRGAWGIETAFDAVAGSGDFEVVVCAEYDALPGLGHACGHNLIASSSLGAAIALAAVADDAGLRVRLLGTPAEEAGGGKIELLAAGAWESAVVSLMAHPRGEPQLRCAEVGSHGNERFSVTYSGRSAHAAAAPHEGVNALDAATVAQVAIGLLRQQLPDTARVGLFIARGGEATNIIPDRVTLRVEVRSFDLNELRDVRRRVLACLEAGALATGCTWEMEPTDPPYLPLLQEPALAAAWDAALAARGRRPEPPRTPLGGSTDMGNVSHVVPSIQPFIAIAGCHDALHTVEFREAALSAAGDGALLDAAVGLATAVLTVALDREARADLLERRSQRPAGATRSKFQI
jgi:amidohydrolase